MQCRADGHRLIEAFVVGNPAIATVGAANGQPVPAGGYAGEPPDVDMYSGELPAFSRPAPTRRFLSFTGDHRQPTVRRGCLAALNLRRHHLALAQSGRARRQGPCSKLSPIRCPMQLTCRCQRRRLQDRVVLHPMFRTDRLLAGGVVPRRPASSAWHSSGDGAQFPPALRAPPLRSPSGAAKPSSIQIGLGIDLRQPLLRLTGCANAAPHGLARTGDAAATGWRPRDRQPRDRPQPGKVPAAPGAHHGAAARGGAGLDCPDG